MTDPEHKPKTYGAAIEHIYALEQALKFRVKQAEEVQAEANRLREKLGQAHYCQMCGTALEEYDGD